MKETKSIKFTKATITQDKETKDFMVEEILKDESLVYNLTDKLKEYCNIEGLTIQIGKVADVPSEE